jgi:hypothetical protein
MFLARTFPSRSGYMLDQRVEIRAVGWYMDDPSAGGLVALDEITVELAWNASTRTISFPSKINGRDVMFGFYAFKADAGNNLIGYYDFYSPFYKDLVLTLSSGNGSAAMSGTRIDMGSLPRRGKIEPVKGVVARPVPAGSKFRLPGGSATFAPGSVFGAR